ncbi:MAG: hypothetical protein V4596_14515 [Bdellovibrionota bacterium]
MKLSLLTLTLLFSNFIFAQEKIDPEKYFENVSALERSQYIEIAETVNPKIKPLSTSDVLAELSETCGYEYKRDSNGIPVLPTVECNYLPAKADNPLDGMTPKFNCAFNKDSDKKPEGKLKKYKVKYSLKNVDQKEIPQAVLTASLMRLLGFYADTYCPAIVVCKGCSPDPWSHKSQAPILADSVVQFKNAVVEHKVKGEKITVTRTPQHPKPLGFEWKELTRTTKNLNPDEKRALLIEREALMMFNNFVYHTDADPHNNRLVCREWVDNGTALRCTDVAAFTHDVGDSFKKMDFGFFEDYKPLSSGGGFLGGTACQGGLDKGEGAIVDAVYSDESRNEFLRRFDLVSDQQLSDLLELAQVRKMGVEPQRWINAFRKNANSMRSVKCPSFDSGKSVLGGRI